MGTLNSCNFGIVEDTYKLFAPKRGVFGVAQSNGVIQIYPRLTLVAMVTKIWFLPKTGYNFSEWRFDLK